MCRKSKEIGDMITAKFGKIHLSVMVLACAMLLLQSIAYRISTTYACGTVTAPIDVEADVGSIHFRGEIAEFYILVSYSGKPIDAEISAMLYYNGSLLANLTDSVENVAAGLYLVRYSIPTEALAGTYALVVNASQCTQRGTTLKSFLLSQTLTNWDARIIDIQGRLVTIETDVGTIKVSLDAINVRLASIEGKIATIETDIGEIQVSLSQINAKLAALNGTVAIIQTDIGIIKTTLGDIEANITDIRGNIAEINTTLGDIRGTLISIEGDIAKIKTDIGNITLSLPPTQTTTYGIPIAAVLAGIGATTSSISAGLLLRRRKTGYQ
jgi:peptidoglycan hydrolase CwlO-like protein